MSVDLDDLRARVERLASSTSPAREEALPVLDALLGALESGAVRAAAPAPDGGGWVVHDWVKRGILLGFRIGRNVPFGKGEETFHFRDRDTFPTWDPHGSGRDVRIVPGGTTVRRGAHLGEGTVLMPPAYVNVGAHVGPKTMIDSHALVGSCAQIGARVHLSAAAQIGGVLEPVGALPVIVEDDAFVGGGCGVYEGARVGAGAVLAPGTVLTGAVPVYDAVRGAILRRDGTGVLAIPPRAVVVPGSRPAAGAFAREHGLHVATPVIVKYRDAGTDAALSLEGALR